MLYAVSGELHFLGFDVPGVVDQYDAATSVEARDKFTQKYRRMRLSKLREHLQHDPTSVSDPNLFIELVKHPQNAMVLNIRSIETRVLEKAIKRRSLRTPHDVFEEVNADRELQDAWDDGASEAMAAVKKAMDSFGPRKARGSVADAVVANPDGTVGVRYNSTGGRPQKQGKYKIINHEAVLVDEFGRPKDPTALDEDQAIRYGSSRQRKRTAISDFPKLNVLPGDDSPEQIREQARRARALGKKVNKDILDLL